MKIKIENKLENTLLRRQDITFLVEHPGVATPLRLDVRAKLAAMLNCSEDQLYITKLAGLYGQNATRGFAHLYPSRAAAEKLEYKHIIQRHLTKEEKPVEAAPPTPQEVAKVDEKKEAKEKAAIEKPEEIPEEKPVKVPKVEEKPKEAPEEKPRKASKKK